MLRDGALAHAWNAMLVLHDQVTELLTHKCASSHLFASKRCNLHKAGYDVCRTQRSPKSLPNNCTQMKLKGDRGLFHSHSTMQIETRIGWPQRFCTTRKCTLPIGQRLACVVGGKRRGASSMNHSNVFSRYLIYYKHVIFLRESGSVEVFTVAAIHAYIMQTEPWVFQNEPQPRVYLIDREYVLA